MPELAKRPVGNTGLNVTLIGFGALEIGRDWGIGDASQRERPDEAAAGDVLRAVLDLGINLIDTASAYHRSEERIGRFLSGQRDRYVLATKCGEHNAEPNTFYDFSYAAVRDSIQRSRQLLQTDVIDILQIHFGPDPQRVLDEGECVRAMKEAQAAGHVRFLGASIDGEVLDRCIESGDFQVVQVGYSLLRQGEGDRIRKARERGIGVFIRSGLARGWLTSRALTVPPAERPAAVNALLEVCGGDGKLLNTLALHFLARHDGISSILVGTKSVDNLKAAVAMMQSPVDEALLDEAIHVVQDGGADH